MTNDRCIPEDIKNQVFERQKGLCNMCGEKLDINTMQLDHIKRVCDRGDNSLENLQYLHESCHNDKTELEELMNNIPDFSSWESNCSGDVMQFFDAPKAQNLIFGSGELCKCTLDSVRSRKNNVDELKHAFPKVGILDTIEPWDDNLKMNDEDMVLIDAGDGDINDPFSWIHYQKATVYPYPTALNILERGVCSSQGEITTHDFKYVLKPSKKLPMMREKKYLIK